MLRCAQVVPINDRSIARSASYKLYSYGAAHSRQLPHHVIFQSHWLIQRSVLAVVHEQWTHQLEQEQVVLVVSDVISTTLPIKRISYSSS